MRAATVAGILNGMSLLLLSSPSMGAERHARLVEAENRRDPTNVFRLNRP
jgi:hypothetical protein